MPTADRTAPTVSNGRVESGATRIDDPPAEQDDRPDDQGLEHERGPPADARGDQAADQRAGGRADARPSR